MIIRATKLLLKEKKYLATTLVVSVFVSILYYLALTSNIDFQTFAKVNSTVYVISQIVLSLLNAILIGLSLAMFLYVFRQRLVQTNNFNVIQTLGSLFLSIFTTGCYVCGSILLPVVGITTSFATLPFGGLEIKFLTILMLLYSIREFSKSILQICEIKKYKTYKLAGTVSNLTFNLSFFDKLKPFVITLTFVVLIFSLPYILPNVNTGFNKVNADACTLEK
jgi:hypothetical protein